MKFTHDLDIHLGWIETKRSPSDYKEVKHLGTCSYDGDMFASYNDEGEINIFKGVLEEEEPLKTETWYKHKSGYTFVYRTGNKRNYAILNDREDNDWACYTPKKWQEANEEEVKEVLVRLAKKKGFKNINELKIKDPYGDVYEKGDFNFEGNKFKLIIKDILTIDGVVIFRKGKWAEILEEKRPLTILAIEERLKRLEDKLL